ncbi:MAG TPA: hypothetical protein VFM46_17895 [Pseudomonadales bacterium]|nr:hypothetical protein [Pseudomonadales bacterium]
MSINAQVQMIVSTIKIGHEVSNQVTDDGLAMRYYASCIGGAKSANLQYTQAEVKIYEYDFTVNSSSLGVVTPLDNKLKIELRTPREFITGLVDLFPHCQPEQDGYLSLNFLLRGKIENGQIVTDLEVMTAEYKAIKHLSRNPDLIQR